MANNPDSAGTSAAGVHLGMPWAHTNVVDVNFEVRITDKKTGTTEVLHETHPMRHFSLPELDLLAQATGFTLIQQ